MKKIIVTVLSLFLFVSGYAKGNDTIVRDGNKLVYTKTYENGMIEKKGFYTLSRKKMGEWTSYHDNGNLNTIGNFKKGKRNGTFQHYNREGHLICVITYENDELITYYGINPKGGLIYKNPEGSYK
tara:strand:+ start:631 stop:1008 length:378 start_codon:yes stop_codon:yes gene_type:complete